MVRLLDRWRWEWRETRCQSDREWRSVKETVEAFSANMPLVREHLLWEPGFWPGGKYGERDGGVWTVDKCSRLQVQLVAGLSSVIHWIGPVVHALLNTSWDVLTTSSYRTVTKAVLKKKVVSKNCVPELVSWCLEPSQPLRITSGLKTNFTLSPSHSFHKSSYHKSWFFLAYLYSVGTQHGNLHPAGWPILFCGPTQKPVLATANTGKTRERFWKKCK